MLILLTYLLYVLLEKSPLYIVDSALSRSISHLLERSNLALYVLCGLKVIDPSEWNYSIYGLLIFQVYVLMLIYSTTTSAVHHHLLLFINCKTAFPTWQIIFSWYRIEVYPRDLYKDVTTLDVELQIL